jgi:hypothetical protein
MRSRALLFLLLAVACRENEPKNPPPVSVTTETVSTATAPEPSAVDPTTVVRELGSKLRMVSLLAPPDVLERSMREHYAPYVAPALLDRWIANPMDAPGRKVSSPWPARIDIGNVTNDGNRSVIEGDIVEVTSETDANGHRIPVRIVVENGRIIEVEIEPATAVISAYYDAINERDYERAYRYWSANPQSLDDFRTGFADTASVVVKTGTPGRIDPAAGSRHVEIPVEITAKTKSGETQRFRGTYMLRRSVVDGATDEQRRWRIASAKISRQLDMRGDVQHEQHETHRVEQRPSERPVADESPQQQRERETKASGLAVEPPRRHAADTQRDYDRDAREKHEHRSRPAVRQPAELRRERDRDENHERGHDRRERKLIHRRE